MHLKPILRVMLRVIIFMLKNVAFKGGWDDREKHTLNCEVMLQGLEDDSVSVIVKGG